MKLLAQDDERDRDGANVPRRPRGRPKLEDVAQIESRLLDVALQEFLAHGYGGTSLSGIVKEAGISKTTLYTRFSSKAELFHAVLRRQIESLAANAALRSPKGSADLVAGLTAYGNRTLEISLEGELLQVNRLIYSEAGRFPAVGEAAAERSRQAIVDVGAFISQCADADGIACSDPQAVATAFVSMLRGWYVDMLLTNCTVSVPERQRWVDTVVRLLLADRADW